MADWPTHKARARGRRRLRRDEQKEAQAMPSRPDTDRMALALVRSGKASAAVLATGRRIPHSTEETE